MKRSVSITIMCIGFCVKLGFVQANPPPVIPYTGFLELPSPAATVNLTVELPRESLDEDGQVVVDANGQPVWSTVFCEKHDNTPLINKRFQINIGRPAGNGDAACAEGTVTGDETLHEVFGSGAVFLRMTVDDTALPRQQFLTAPYASRAVGRIRLEELKIFE